MKKFELKTRKLLRTIFGGISLTAVAFIFQACYGVPSPPYYNFDARLSGKVLSKTDKQPIKGIKVSVANALNFAITDEDGNFSFYAHVENYRYDSIMQIITLDSIPVLFSDIDSTENGYFIDKEIVINHRGQDEVKINIELEEK